MTTKASILTLAVPACCLLAVPCLFAQGPTAVAPLSLGDIIEQVRPSIVSVKTTYQFHTTENPQVSIVFWGTGTGFIVDPDGDIATAGHVVGMTDAKAEADKMAISRGNQHLDEGSLIRTAIMITFPAPSVEEEQGGEFYGNSAGLPATIIAEDDMVDIAVLRCSRNPINFDVGQIFVINGKSMAPPITAAKLQTSKPRDGDMISVSGFPLGIPVLVTNTGWIASAFFKDEKNRSLYLGSILVNHGNSGGPAYNDTDGAVIGVVVEYRQAPEGNSGITVIVPIKRVIDLIPKTTTR
jgi:S1-C subfamily serine protease